MLRSYKLALLLVTLAAAGCSDLPDTIEPKPAAAGSGGAAGAAAGKSGGGSGASAGKGGTGGKGGSGGKKDHDDAGADQDASS